MIALSFGSICINALDNNKISVPAACTMKNIIKIISETNIIIRASFI